MSTPEVPADSLFQVGDQQPVSLAHLERVNHGLTLEDRAAIAALQRGESIVLTQDDVSVRVRRTR
jgi:hypothetical protein